MNSAMRVVRMAGKAKRCFLNWFREARQRPQKKEPGKRGNVALSGGGKNDFPPNKITLSSGFGNTPDGGFPETVRCIRSRRGWPVQDQVAGRIKKVNWKIASTPPDFHASRVKRGIMDNSYFVVRTVPCGDKAAKPGWQTRPASWREKGKEAVVHG